MMALSKYKLCPACGEQNPTNLLECRKCETDLTGIGITDSLAVEKEEEEKSEEETACSYVLTAVGDMYSVTIDQPVCIIGREAGLKDYLGGRMYVSRQHAKLTMAEGKVWIENLSRTNQTFINNAALSGTEPAALSDGDEIGLGGMEINGKRQSQAAYFLFREKI